MTLANQDPALRPSSVPWPPILLAGTIGAAMALGRILPVDWPGAGDTAAQMVGRGIGIAGGLLIAWAVITLARAKTTVMPHQAVSHLVTTGPFAWRRNPIYLGEMMVLLGLGEVTKNIWFVLLTFVFAALVTWLSILPEERHLEAKFGEAWRAYAHATRRLL